MSTYLPAIIWMLSSVLCMAIARHRHIKPTAAKAMLVALTGPVAIPFVMAAKR
jgi:hypothetical protein